MKIKLRDPESCHLEKEIENKKLSRKTKVNNKNYKIT